MHEPPTLVQIGAQAHTRKERAGVFLQDSMTLHKSAAQELIRRGWRAILTKPQPLAADQLRSRWL